ncbi:hypothetical protein OPQ81_005568 [Rhizoctonia solani]|nr:hypothetical protein OPQ81_005568 [Rhizoctonia solani]
MATTLMNPFQETHRLERENSRRPVNRLPCEVLSHIFILCKNKERERGYPDIFCLTVLPTVCKHWRKVALDTKQLWSLVTLFDPPPFKFSSLYLERSGTTTPLDIEIRLSNRFWGFSHHPDRKLYTLGMTDALNTIVKCGGCTSRWNSFWLYTPVRVPIYPQLAVLDFIRNLPMPALERFETAYTGKLFLRTLAQLRQDKSTDKFLFAVSAPKCLKVASLQAVPSTYMFLHADRLRLPSLTRLELQFVLDLPPLGEINTVLAAMPKLKVLSIDTSDPHRVICSSTPFNSRTFGNLPKIPMPNLRALALHFTTYASLSPWEYALLLMLDAPNVQSLSLRLYRCASEVRLAEKPDFVEYLVKGADLADPRPLFPRLTTLELFISRSFSQIETHTTLDEVVLAAYPTVTTLVLPSFAQPFHTSLQPQLLPHLDRLIIGANTPFELKTAMEKRCAAGRAPKVVEVQLLINEGAKCQWHHYQEVADELGFELYLSDYRVREVLGFEDA